MKVEITTDLGTYTVTEKVTRDGRLELSFATSNPPRGLHPDIWAWNGRLSALSGPFEGPEGVAVTVSDAHGPVEFEERDA